jgi:hypothetical protein
MLADVTVHTWSNQLVALLVLFFLLPIALHYLKLIVNGQPQDVYVVEIIEDDKPVTFEDIKRAALKKAAQGDASARKWVMENVYKKNAPYAAVKQPEPKTPEHIIKDTVSALVSLKMKRAEAVEAVRAKAMDKRYNSVNELLVAVMRKK